MLRYLSRYTHRVAISNRRLIAADHVGVAFRWKDYRIDGPGRWKTMRLHPARVHPALSHARAAGFHRIRHYGLFANANRAETIAAARALLGAGPPAADPTAAGCHTPRALRSPCPHCGARMIVIEVFRGAASQVGGRPQPRATCHDPDRLSAPPLSRSVAPTPRWRRFLSAKPRQSASRSAADTLHAATKIPIARFQHPFRTLSRSPGASFAPTVVIGAKIKSP